jgi:hypothetical protein
VEIASFVLSLAAVMIAGASVMYTKRQAGSAALQAAEAQKTTAIESKRLHSDLEPVIRLTGEVRDGQGQQAQIRLELTGPPGLDRLDQVRVRIRDDMPRQPEPRGAQVVQDNWAEVIWGPYRIKAGLRDTDQYGREHGPFALPKNEPYPIPLEQSFAPAWQKDWQSWRDQYAGAPVRLEITCIRDGYEPWVLTPEVTLEIPPELRQHVW